MGRKGYVGSTSHIIRDVTGSKSQHVLINCGETFYIFSEKDLEDSLDDMIDAMEDREVYLQWYNCPLL